MLIRLHVRCLVGLVGFVMLGAAAPLAAHPRHAPVLHVTFPSVPGAEFQDDYDAPRGRGRAHRATDVFAPPGSPVFAAAAGTVTWLPGRHPSAGYAMHVRGDDGRTYAYYHLGPDAGPRERAYAPGIREGATVRRGQVLGYLGDSGSALGTRPHLHFEIHEEGVADPYGTNRLDPYPSLAAAVRRGDFGRRADQAVSREARPLALLRLGDRGAEVAAWQRLLNASAAAGLGVDGVFGPRTHAATHAFQQAHGLEADGVVGPRTRAAMSALTDTGLLRLGDRGAGVAAWQRLLAQATGQALRADGIFGRVTESATLALQRTHGLREDGIVGPRTRLAAARAA